MSAFIYTTRFLDGWLTLLEHEEGKEVEQVLAKLLCRPHCAPHLPWIILEWCSDRELLQIRRT